MKNYYTVHVASTDEFAASREAWNALVRRMYYPTPFATWEWIYTWWENFRPQSSMLPILVHQGARLAAILPLFHASGRASRGLWSAAVTLDYGGGEDLGADHLDIICATDEVEACGHAILAHLVTQHIDWDVIRVAMVADDGGLRRTFWCPTDNVGVDWNRRSLSPYVELPDSFDEFMARLPRKDRHTVRSQHRKAINEGARYVSFEGAERESGLKHLFVLHEERASQKGIDSSFTNEATMRFHTALLQRMSHDELFLRGLCVGDEIIAGLYAFRIGSRTFLYQLGHAPAWAHLSPGVAIVTESIREAIELGCTEYNFLQGDEPYKRNWARRSRSLLQLNLYNHTFVAYSTRVVENARRCAKGVVRRWQS